MQRHRQYDLHRFSQNAIEREIENFNNEEATSTSDEDKPDREVKDVESVSDEDQTLNIALIDPFSETKITTNSTLNNNAELIAGTQQEDVETTHEGLETEQQSLDTEQQIATSNDDVVLDSEETTPVNALQTPTPATGLNSAKEEQAPSILVGQLMDLLQEPTTEVMESFGIQNQQELFEQSQSLPVFDDENSNDLRTDPSTQDLDIPELMEEINNDDYDAVNNDDAMMDDYSAILN